MSNLRFEIQNLTPEELETWEKSYLDCQVVRFGPKKFIVFTRFLNVAKEIQDLKLRDDDIFICGHSRSGTTMSKEMVWLLNNNMDFEKALSTRVDERAPFFERKLMQDISFSDEFNSLAIAEVMNKNKPPRMFLSHLPISFLPSDLVSTAKVVYLARDPRDVVVSQFFLLNPFILKPECKLENYLDLFLQGLRLFGPYFPHVNEAWELRNHPNLLFLFYEELIKDLPGVVRRVAKFLGKTYTDEQYSKLCEHLNFDNFKKNEMIRPVLFEGVEEFFIRKGKVGGWRDYFDEEMSAKADKWMDENLRNTDLRFPNFD